MARPMRDLGQMQRDAQNGHAPKGIPCPECGSTRRRVFRTRPTTGVIVRETICLDCDEVSKTFETP